MESRAKPVIKATGGVGWAPFIFLFPFLFFLSLFWVLPLLGGVKMSLESNGLGAVEFVGFKNYYA